MQKVKLYWIDPAAGPQEYVVEQTPLIIGRDMRNQIVLYDDEVSRRHAMIEYDGDQVVINDLHSRNGIRLNGQPVQRAALMDGAQIQIGTLTLTLTVEHPALVLEQATILARVPDDATLIATSIPQDVTLAVSPALRVPHDATQVVSPALRVPNDATQVVSPAQRVLVRAPAIPAIEWPPALFNQQLVSVQALQQLGLPVSTAEYATIGAGLGSFVWSDLLRISGVKPEKVVALGMGPRPYGHYKLLTRNSQIPDHERLRSNSESTPDNIWGWPGYAAREIWADFWRGNIGRAWSTFWQIFGEPALTDTYTPRIGDVFRALDRETKRIGWDQIFRYGRVRAIRKTDDGRYVVAYSTRGADSAADQAEHAFLITRYLHMATGYPAIQFLKDLQKYREQTRDFTTVVNAYEEHDHIYEHLRKHGGLVMLRGRGIVASRILQRIYEERAYNPNIGIIHLIRKPVAKGFRYGRSQREVIDHFEFQPFNWPRGCWTGPQRKQLERASPDERKQLLETWGGTTTAKRQDWVNLIDQGQREGWYQVAFGEVERVARNAEGQLVTVVKASGQVSGELHYATDFIIDATGLDAKAKVNPLLKDMVEHYALALNPLERLHVENDFEVSGMRNGTGRMYAAGAMTLGGPNAGVDTFLGLQYAALRSVDSLRRLRALGIRKVDGLRSIIQWLKWAQGVKP